MLRLKNVLKKLRLPQLKRAKKNALQENNGTNGKKRRKKLSKNKKILLLVGAVVLLACIYLVYQLFFTEDEKVALTELTTYGSLNRTIEGSGTTEPLDTQTVTLASDTEVLHVYVKEGDTVQVGDPLYEQDDSEIDDEILEYETEINELTVNLSDYNDQLTEAKENQSNLTVTAPFSGRISDITVAAGDDIASGSKLAAITDDSVMTLTQYYSYAYQGMISVGSSIYVSVADQMLLLVGRVTDVESTNYISADGTKCFTVEIDVPNPGSLTEGQIASSYATYNGEDLYPVDTGELGYGNYTLLNAEASGAIAKVKVSDYQEVTAGQTLFVIDSDTYEKQISNLQATIENCQKQIDDYEQKIEEAEDDRANYLVTADIAGTVMQVNISEGKPTRWMQDQTAVTVYNLDTMTITVNVDELDVDYLTEGMTVNVSRTSAETTTDYEGAISYISFQGTESDGVSTFPVTIEIPSAGALSSGVNVTYSVNVGDDTEEGVLAPVEAIQSTSVGDCLFVKADQKPENAVELTGEDDPEVPDGFYAVPVEVGAANSTSIRILSGVEQDVEVFTRYQQTAPTNGDTTSQDLGEDTTQQQQQMPTMPNGSSGGWSGGMPSGGPSMQQ